MRNDSDKRKRQELIREIIRSKPIRSQNELVKEISFHKLSVTQTTVSRDLDELAVGKWNGQYHIPYGPDETPSWFETIQTHVESVSRAGPHLIVLHSKNGTSSIVEKTLNDVLMPEITGIVASQSTVFVAFESPENQSKVFDLLHPLVKNTVK